ncbi:MAG TPA: energy transducer TonB [Acidobacteriota bacterium]|nr:energy transducer TonB [Acidobacteriota bacterium]
MHNHVRAAGPWASRALLSAGTLVLLLIQTGLAAAQERQDTTWRMVFPSDPQRQHVLGTVVQRDGRWEAYTVALRLDDSSRPMRRGLYHFTSGAFSHREWVRVGQEVRFRPYNEVLEMSLKLLNVDQGQVEAEVTVPFDMPGQWRLLTAAPPHLPPDVIDFNQAGGQDHLQGPRALRSRMPTYPKAAREASVNGKVVLGFVLDEKGQVSPDSIRVVRGLGYGLEEAAIETLLNEWKLAPGRRDGQPVSMWINVEFDFSIH